MDAAAEWAVDMELAAVVGLEASVRPKTLFKKRWGGREGRRKEGREGRREGGGGRKERKERKEQQAQNGVRAPTTTNQDSVALPASPGNVTFNLSVWNFLISSSEVIYSIDPRPSLTGR